MSEPLPKPVKVKRARKPIRRASRPKRESDRLTARAHRRLWVMFAKYVKERDGNQCVSCQKQGLEGRDWQAGHWITRRNQAVMFDPGNCHSQCSRCNLFLKGNHHEYLTELLCRYGSEKVLSILDRSKRLRKWTLPDLELLIGALSESPAKFEMVYEENFGTFAEYGTADGGAK